MDPITVFLAAGRQKLASKRAAEAAEKAATEAARLEIRKEAWGGVMEALCVAAPELVQFAERMPESFAVDLLVPDRTEVFFNIPGLYRFSAVFANTATAKTAWAWEQVGHHQRGQGKLGGKWLVRWPSFEYDRHGDDYVGQGENKATDDLAEALAIAEEAEVEHQKVLAQIEQQIEQRKSARERNESRRGAEPTAEDA